MPSCARLVYGFPFGYLTEMRFVYTGCANIHFAGNLHTDRDGRTHHKHTRTHTDEEQVKKQRSKKKKRKTINNNVMHISAKFYNVLCSIGTYIVRLGYLAG